MWCQAFDNGQFTAEGFKYRICIKEVPFKYFFKDSFWIPFALNKDFAGKSESIKTLLSLNTFLLKYFLISFALITDFCWEKGKKVKHEQEPCLDSVKTLLSSNFTNSSNKKGKKSITHKKLYERWEENVQRKLGIKRTA